MAGGERTSAADALNGCIGICTTSAADGKTGSKAEGGLLTGQTGDA